MYRRAVSDIPSSLRPVVAPVLWGALQLVSASDTWFLAEWTDSCWSTRRQVVCTFVDKARGKLQCTSTHWTVPCPFIFFSFFLSASADSLHSAWMCMTNALEVFLSLTNLYLWQPYWWSLCVFFLVLQCFIYSLRFFMVKNQWWNNFWMMEEKVVIGSPYQYNSYFCFVFLLFGQSGDAGANPCCLGLKGTFTSWTSF